MDSISVSRSVRFWKCINLVNFWILCKISSKFSCMHVQVLNQNLMSNWILGVGDTLKMIVCDANYSHILDHIKFYKFENLWSLPSFFNSVTKSSKHLKVCSGGKSRFSQGSNHQIVLKYAWNPFSWSCHQIQTYIYFLSYVLVESKWYNNCSWQIMQLMDYEQ